MKILHFIYDHVNNPWVGGGGAVRALEIYRRLRERHQITVVCGKYPGAINYFDGTLRYEFEGTDKNNYVFSTLWYAVRAAGYLKTNAGKYDVVVEDFAPWNPVFAFRYRRKRAIVLQIQSRMGYEIIRRYNVFGTPFYLLEKWYPGKFENIIYISPSLKESAGIPGVIISNGIDENLLDLDACRDGYIGFLGRLDIYTKGIDTLLDAVRGLGLSVKCAGDGRDRNAFLGTIRGIENVEWLGMVKGERKKDFLCKMEFLVLPSRFEGQGIAVLEAAASGKPAIVSDIPGLRYAVDEGFALSFRTGDARDLRAKIELLYNDAGLLQEMGTRARQYAKNFTWDRIAEEYENYLLGIAGKTPLQPA